MLLSSAGALAQTAEGPGWYAGISLGSATANLDRQFTEVTGATASSVSADDKSNYGKIYAGYQLQPWFALEGGFTNLGTYGATRTVTSPSAGSLNAKVRTRGIHIDAVFMARTQTNFTPFGKIGVVTANTRIEYAATGAVALVGDSDHDQNDGFLKLGVGLSYAFARNLAARIEFEHLNAGRKNSDSPEDDVDVYRDINAFSLGLVYRF